MKLVIDTNVFIDGDLDDNSYANKIVDEILNGRIQVFANPATVREYGLKQRVPGQVAILFW